jgi:hypothetical protein
MKIFSADLVCEDGERLHQAHITETTEEQTG